MRLHALLSGVIGYLLKGVCNIFERDREYCNVARQTAVVKTI